jgi:osmoprotectant transport system substrate-binding protein
MCVASEFAGRSAGLPGLEKAYGFTVPKAGLASLAEGASYDAVGKGNPCIFGETTTTDGRQVSPTPEWRIAAGRACFSVVPAAAF